jgi:hypothetical protein
VSLVLAALVDILSNWAEMTMAICLAIMSMLFVRMLFAFVAASMRGMRRAGQCS